MQTQPMRMSKSPKIRAYRLAPWRAQTRLLTIGLVAVFGVMALLSLFVFAGAQAAEAGLRVQSMIRSRDALLRKLESQEGDLARLRSETYLRKRALELGFLPAQAGEVDFVDIPAAPVTALVVVSPTAVLFTEEPMSLPPAYKETLLESLLNQIQTAGRK
jgi:hypothetical protein